MKKVTAFIGSASKKATYQTTVQAGKELHGPQKLRKILLICGILSTILWIGTDIYAAMQYEGYSYRDQVPSELSAIGAPTQHLWIAMLFVYNPLLIAFGIGVWKSAGAKRSLCTTGILLSAWGILGFLWQFFPMHMRGTVTTATDIGHLVMSGVTILAITLFIAFGSGIRGKWFRLYSFMTILVMLVLGAWVGQQTPRVAADLPTPWLGVIERVMVYAPMLWAAVLAVILLRFCERNSSEE